MWVAPNSIAISKSPLMPMLRCARPLRLAILANSAKCGAGSSPSGGTHIRPVTGSLSSSRQSVMKRSASAGAIPAFCGSSPVLTSIRQVGRNAGRPSVFAVSPVFCISRASARASFSRSRVSMTSNRPSAWRTLLVCKGPTRCSSILLSPRSAGYFISASCTRFSPKTFCPAASAARTAAWGWVLATATRIISAASRPARKAASAIRRRTSARLAAILSDVTGGV